MSEGTISPSSASSTYAEDFPLEDEVLAAARQRAREVGVEAVTPGGGAFLQVLAQTIGASTVVEVGTGAGVSGLWLLRGMPTNGVLTTVDTEAEHHRLARQTFTEAGISGQRTRLITGKALDVLPRLADHSYDLVFLDADTGSAADYYAEALRLLRVGGVVVLSGALGADRVADPAQRDPETVAIRELGKQIREDARVQAVLLPLAGGLLTAVRLAEPTD